MWQGQIYFKLENNIKKNQRVLYNVTGTLEGYWEGQLVFICTQSLFYGLVLAGKDPFCPVFLFFFNESCGVAPLQTGVGF